MTSVNIDPNCPIRSQPQRFCRNGQIVDAGYQGQLAQLVNQIARFRTKEYAAFPGDVVAPVQDKLWRFAGCIGPMARTMVARVVMAPSNQVVSTHNPYMQLTLYDTSGTVIGSGRAFYGASYGATANETPNEWATAVIAIDVRSYKETLFRAELSAVESARAISAIVYEVAEAPDTDNGYVNQSYSVGQPILDTDRSSIVDLAHRIWKYGGPALITWSSSTDASAVTTASPRNIIDNVLLGATTNKTAGFDLDLRYASRKTKSTVPVKFDAYAFMSSLAAGSGFVYIMSEGGFAGSVAISSTAPQWFSTTLNLPATLDRYYIGQESANGLQNITTYAVSMYRYGS